MKGEKGRLEETDESRGEQEKGKTDERRGVGLQ